MPDSFFLHIRNTLLTDPENGVERVIQEANDLENMYVEFKTNALKPDLSKIPEERDSKCTRPDDYLWNIMKEIIAFANTSGGVIFVGIADDLSTPDIDYEVSKDIYQPVKEDKDWDEYKRVISQKLRGKKDFNPTNPNHPDSTIKYTIEDSFKALISKLFTIDRYRYKDGFVLGIIVNPGEKDDSIIFVKKDGKNGLLVRRSGEACWIEDPLETRLYTRPGYTTSPILHRIPSPSKPFVGREQELLDLHGLLSPYRKGMRKIPVLTGPESIGKHTLACKYRERFWLEYDTVINASNLKCAKDVYLEMAGDQDFLTCFGIVFNERDDDEQKIKKIKHALFDKPHGHILILLEEIQKPSDIFLDESFPDLFSGPGEDSVHILATSSSKLDWNVGENDLVIPFPIEGLTEQEGLELLRQWRCFEPGSTEGKAASDIVKILKGHTGLLAGVGRELKQRHPPHDDDYREKLKLLKSNSHKTLQKQMESIYAPIVEKLDKNRRMILYAASLCPDGWIREDVFYKAFVSFTGNALDRRAWEELFIALPDHYLLRTAQGTKSIYSIDDSILRRHFAEEVANDDDAKALFGKYVENCLDVASETERKYYIDYYLNGQGKKLFTPLEIANIFLSKPHHRFFFLSFWEAESPSHDLLTQFDKIFQFALLLKMPPALLFLQQMKSEYKNIPLYAFMLEYLFKAKHTSNDLISFCVFLQQAISQAPSSGNMEMIPIYESNLYDIGLILVRTIVFMIISLQPHLHMDDNSRKEEISSALENSLLTRKGFLTDLEMAYYCNEFGRLFGALFFEFQDFDRALNCHLKALELVSGKSDVPLSLLFLYYNNVGCAYLDKGDKTNARKYFAFAFDISQKTDEITRNDRIMINTNLGALTMEFGNDEESIQTALSYFETAEELADGYPSEKTIKILYNKSLCHSRLHNAEAVIDNCQKALIVSATANVAPDEIKKMYPLMIQANEYLHRYAESLACRFKLLEFVKKDSVLKKSPEIATIYSGIGLTYFEGLKNFDEAIKYFEKSRDIYLSISANHKNAEDQKDYQKSILFCNEHIQKCKEHLSGESQI